METSQRGNKTKRKQTKEATESLGPHLIPVGAARALAAFICHRQSAGEASFGKLKLCGGAEVVVISSGDDCDSGVARRARAGNALPQRADAENLSKREKVWHKTFRTYNVT